MQIGDGDASGEDGVVGMLCGHCGRSLGSQVVQFDRGDARVQTVDDLLGDLGLLSNAMSNLSN